MTIEPTKPSKFTEIDYDPFDKETISRVVPTTESQREIWLADRLERGASLAYNESISLRFVGSLDSQSLQNAFKRLVNRHEALRATISANGEEMVISSDVNCILKMIDLADAGPEVRNRLIADARKSAVETPFDLVDGPLIRGELIKITANEHLLIVTAHHIICDGWSFGVLIRDLASLYAREIDTSVGPLPPAPSYCDYATAQRDISGREERAVNEAWWVEKYRGTPPTLELPIDRPRPAWRGFASNRFDYFFDAALVAGIRAIGARHGAGLFGTMLACFAAVLNRVTGADDVVVGIPAAGQSVGGHDNLVGHCVNLLPIRVPVDRSSAIGSLVARAQTELLDAYEHQGFTFGSLLKKLPLMRDTSRLPLVNVIFNIDQALDTATIDFPGIHFEFESNARSFENFELFVNSVPTKGGLILECQYNSGLFDESTIKQLLGHMECVIRSAISDPSLPVANLSLVTAAERTALLARHCQKASFPVTECLHDTFARHAARNPDHIAATCDGRQITYARLDTLANQLANRLVAMGVGANVLVGLNVERSLDLLVGVLGILKAGGGYLPLDPVYPADRVAFILMDARAPVLITQSALASRLPPTEAQILCIDSDWPADESPKAPPVTGNPEDLAYVIYTSGSTGKPKGVEISHSNVARLFSATEKWYAFNETDVWTMFHSYAFDFSVWEIWGALFYGGRVVIVPYMVSRSPEAFHDLLAHEKVTVLNQTPSAFRQLIVADEAKPPGRKLFLRYIIFGGEALDTSMLKAWYERHPEDAPRLVNMYGITETTVHVTYRPLGAADAASNSSPIGEPIPDLSLFVLDECLEPVPIGVPGELYVGGAGLARGYLGRPDLTESRFIRDPFSNQTGARLYKSGDIARHTSQGSLEFIGRADNQVKVRGHRIELGEIDAQLAAFPQIAHAMTILREDRPGDLRLVSYYVSRDNQQITEGELKAHLKKSLPDYMVPPHFIGLPSIPLTENGKVNRSALPTPSSIARPQAEFIAPRNEIEKAVVTEMEESLGLPGIGICDDFFALGGHSLLAAQLTSRLNKKFNSQLSMRHLFEAPSAKQLAALLLSDKNSPRQSVTRRTDPTTAPLTVMQERMWFLEQLYPGRVTYNGPSAHRLRGPMNEEAFERAFNEMVARQPSLRTSFEQDGNLVRQRIHERTEFRLFPAEDLTAIAQSERGARLQSRLEELTAQTFDLSCVPLFKVHVFKLDNDDHVLFFMAHHIIWDGWSFDLLYNEMSSLYESFDEDKPIALPHLTVDYGDFAIWHRQWLESDEFADQLAFWRGRMEEISRAKELPTDLRRQPGMSGNGSTEWIKVDKTRTDALHRIASELDTTVFIVTISIYAVMLHGYSRQSQLVIGTPVRGRNSVELEVIMGFFNTLLPLPIVIDSGETFRSLLGRMRSVVIDGLKHPDVPLEQLSQERTQGGERASLLYQALFSFQDARQRITKWGNLTHENILLFQKGATEDLGMWFVETDTGLHGGVTYNTDVLVPETAAMLRDAYVVIIDKVLNSTSVTVGELASPLLSTVVSADSVSVDSQIRSQAVSAQGTPPATPNEILLAKIWCDELKLAAAFREDNFFDLGGHSLLAMQVMIRMEELTGKRINPQRFIFDSLAQIATAYDCAEAAVKELRGVRGLFSRFVGTRDR